MLSRHATLTSSPMWWDADMSYVVIAHYTCPPDDAADVQSRLLTMREHTLDEPANRAYVVHAVEDKPGEFILYEEYDDRAGFDAHATTPHFEEHIVGYIRPRLTDRQVTFASVV